MTGWARSCVAHLLAWLDCAWQMAQDNRYDYGGARQDWFKSRHIIFVKADLSQEASAYVNPARNRGTQQMRPKTVVGVTQSFPVPRLTNLSSASRVLCESATIFC